MTEHTTTIHEIDPATLRAWLDRKEALLVDVREPDEHAREHIGGARLVPLSRFSPASVPAANGTRIVLHCKSGRRSAEACARLLQSGVEAITLKGGIEAWKAAGLPVETDTRMPISIMRQVQMFIGAAVLAGSLLAATVSPWFLVLTGFFGVGLFFAGATGMCGLAAVMGAMPWNRAFRAAGACAATDAPCCNQKGC